ncbi:MAG: S8 family peptidase [Maribacter sp.]|nr:S8 family peptidase [Maribacter sp.]
MKKRYFVSIDAQRTHRNKNYANFRWQLPLLFCLFFVFVGHAQKNKDIIPVVYCVKDLSNGLLQASFGYVNPTNKEVVIDENGSIIKSNNGKRVAKGLNKFKSGSVNKVFTKEFGPGDYVEWTIISNGNTHTVIANANSSKCSVNDGFIEPVLNNGKSYEIIGQELSSLCDNPVSLIPSPLIFQLKDDKVLIEIVPNNGQLANLITLLQGPPFNIPSSDFLLYEAGSSESLVDQLSRFAVIDVYFTKPDLCLLNDYSINNLTKPYINFARPVYPATNNSGGVITQGDAAQTSNIVRASFRTVDADGAIVPVDGKGITIGVLSDSYDMALPGESFAALDIANGELPADPIIVKDNASKSSDEGRAMMQILHDVAPGAALQFHTATASPRQFEEGFNALALSCDMVVDDITFITEPFFLGTGRIATAIQSFVSQPGKFHVTSAGNLANKSYQSTFAASSNVPVTNFIPTGSSTRAHLFDGTGDYLQKIHVDPGTYLIALQWKELLASQGSAGALEDLDIYIVDDLGRLLVGSNRVNIAGDPTEIIVFRATGSGNANILITSANGPTNVPFRYIAFHTAAADGTPDGLKFPEYFGNGAPTVSGHAMNPASITTGAVDYRKASSPVAETFSSYGGLLKDGTTLAIDLYAPDGGNTASTTIGQNAQCDTCDKDGVLNFYGTSASAPHLAGAMALLMSAAPSWFPDGSGSTTYSADQALQLFKSSATPFAAADGSAAGFLNTLAAFKTIASQTAKITELRVEDGKTPSAEPFTVTIIGEFFPENVDDFEILFNDQPLEDVQIITEDGQSVITATVPTFSGNPALFVVTNSITPGGADGGASDPAYFFDEGKLALNILANNAQFEYGQDITSYYRADANNPEYVPPFTVEGLPEGVTFESLEGLPPVVLNNTALDEKLAEGGYPIVFDYVITPSFGDQDYDHDLYQINFISGYIDPDEGKVGYLTINKKDLTITPEPLTVTYGDAILNTLRYDYDATGISDNSRETGFYSLIDATHQSDYKDGLPNKFQAVVSKFQAVVSGYDLLDLLNGGSWSASERTIQNKFQAVVSGMNTINLDNENFTNYIDARLAYDNGTTNKFQAVVSKFQAVVSAEDLFSGVVDLGIENKFQAVVSKFQAVVSTDDPDRPYSGYESVFSIIDAEDAPPDDGSDPDRAISDMYSLNMITGLDVTPGTEGHVIYPGAFLNAMSANFNITYAQGSLTVLPKDLTASINNLIIPYGTHITKNNLISSFDGWAFEGEYQESLATVFPEEDGGIPYYFIKEGGDGTELEIDDLKEIGDYAIKIRNPENYLISNTINDTYGTLTIEPATLAFNPVAIQIAYGDIPVIDPAGITGFAEGEDATVLEGNDGNIPYYFKKVDGDGTTYVIGEKMDVGVYDIFITDDPMDNYLIVPDANRGTLTVNEATLSFNPEAVEFKYGEIPNIDPAGITGFAEGEDAAVLEGTDGKIPYYFKKVDGDDTTYTIGQKIDVGEYGIFITDDLNDNYIIVPDVNRGTLTISKAPLTFNPVAPTIKYGETPVIDPRFGPFAYDDDPITVFPNGIPYYFVDASGNEIGQDDNLNVGDYEIWITETESVPQNYTIDYGISHGQLTILKESLYATIQDLVVDEGTTIDASMITTAITGYVNNETQQNVFSGGIQYRIEDVAGNPYMGDAGVYFIKIIEPANFNYMIEYLRIGTVYINSSNNMRKIRTYTDCVEENPGDPDGLFYIAHFRYENPNDEAIYILEGPENLLSGPAQYSGELPIKFLPGEHTFEIRFDGNTLKWELTSMDSNHKTSTTTNVNANSNKCDASSTTNTSGIPKYVLHPNPVKDGILYIEQDISAMVTLDVFDFYGILYLHNQLNGTNAPTTHVIDMSGYPNGMYFIRLSANDDVQVFSVVKE